MGIEPAVEMRVAADGVASLVRTQTHQCDPPFIAEEAQQVQHAALLAVASGEQILHLVDHQHAWIDLLEQRRTWVSRWPRVARLGGGAPITANRRW